MSVACSVKIYLTIVLGGFLVNGSENWGVPVVLCTCVLYEYVSG